jgi:hypothetical protein
MSTAAALTDLPTTASTDWAQPLVDRQLQILGRLAEAGLEIAVALETQAKGGEVVVQGDVAMAYSRVARAVRQTIMLQSKVIEVLQARETARAGRKAAARGAAARILKGVIEDGEGGDGEPGERLKAEAAERLEQEDFSDLLTRPFAEVVAGICRDLGLSPDALDLAEACCVAEAGLYGPAGEGASAAPAFEGVEVQWLPAGDSS